MSILSLVLSALLVVACRAVPKGYILDVSHTCGDVLSSGLVAAENASVTITSDLHVMAHLKCAGAAPGSKLDVAMPAVNDSNTESKVTLYYPGDTGGTPGTDCFFFSPHTNSHMFVVELEVYWGFTNGTLMNDYETYTITCTTDGSGSKSLAGKGIDDKAISITDDLQENIGRLYTDTVELKLIDVLGNEITAENVPMAKKVELKLEISGGDEVGVMPYECEAHNSDNSESYKLLTAGCGDGVIFKKTEGFETTAKVATSPYFRAFKVIEAMGSPSEISYSCSFSTCNTTCDGSSCAISRTKRSLKSPEEPRHEVRSQKYNLERLDNRLDHSESDLRDFKLDTHLRISTIALYGVGVVAVLSLIIALYSCIGLERRRIYDQRCPAKVPSA